MPIILNHSSHQDQVALWKIIDGEFDNSVTGVKVADGLNIMQNQRIRQKRACLALVSLLAGAGKDIYYDENGKPHFVNDRRKLSFTHSGEYAAMMLSEKFAGIDFEKIRPKVMNIVHKFLNEPELNSLHPVDTIEHAHVYWGAKEALYKVYGKQQLVFKEHILLEPFDYLNDKGYFFAHLETPSIKKKFKLFYEKMFGFMMVYVVND